MKKIFSAAVVPALFFISCSKEASVIAPGDTENPAIKIISPLNVPNLKPGDYFTIKAIITDNKLINTAAWEAMHAASACGSNPYKAEYSPAEPLYEMNVKFLVPPNFSGERFIRLYAVDNSGNFSTQDIYFNAGN